MIAPPPWTLQGDAYALLTRALSGGLGMLMLVRYRASNVGPYDELLWLKLRARGHYISPIFVSSQDSALSGRVNWGLAKEVARFDQIDATTQVVHGDKRVCALAVSPGRAALPATTALLPSMTRRFSQTLAGVHYAFAPSARGRLHVARVDIVSLDRTVFADVGRPLLGLALLDFTMRFPVATTTPLPTAAPPPRPQDRP